MEAIFEYILAKFGIPGGMAVMLYIIINYATKQRKEERDAQIDSLNQRTTKLENKQGDLEKDIVAQVQRIYDRLTTIGKVNSFTGSQIVTEFAGVDLWKLKSDVRVEVCTNEGRRVYAMLPGFPTNMRSGSHLIDWLIPKFTKNNDYNAWKRACWYNV